MIIASVSNFRARLSMCIEEVKRGDEVLVTERGKPIARMVPVEEYAPKTPEQLERVQQRVIRLGKGRLSRKLLESLPVVNLPMDVILRVMEEEREDRC